MKTMKKLLAASAVALLVSSVQAAPITYTFIGDNVSGNLGGSAFTGRTLTVTLEGDTDNVLPGSPGAPTYNTSRNPGLTGTFDISGVGSGTFTDSLRVFKSSSSIGFGDTSDIFWLFWGDSYDLIAEASVSGLQARRQNNTVNTDLGILNITATSTGSFSASYPTSAEVPEPASLALLGLGIVGVGARRLLARTS